MIGRYLTMSNYVSNENADKLFEEIGKKKLTVTDVMPLAASAANEGIPYLYLGATTQDYKNGSIYKCKEVTPATDPKTYYFDKIYDANVDLSKYKRIWGGTVEGWEALTDEEKAQYEYTFFNNDSPVVEISGYQKEDLETPLTIEGVQQTTVEGALGKLKDIVNLMGKDVSSFIQSNTAFALPDEGSIFLLEFNCGSYGASFKQHMDIVFQRNTPSIWISFNHNNHDDNAGNTLWAQAIYEKDANGVFRYTWGGFWRGSNLAHKENLVVELDKLYIVI